jgi:hypothetical protein
MLWEQPPWPHISRYKSQVNQQTRKYLYFFSFLFLFLSIKLELSETTFYTVSLGQEKSRTVLEWKF